MRLTTTLLALSVTATLGAAETIPAGWFAWPAVEPVDGSALDLRALNQDVAGAAGRILTKDGRFVTPDGKRVRFLATNLGGHEAFPATQQEADGIARRLAKAGINLVRLHHLDNVFTGNGGSLWNLDTRDRHTMVPEQLNRLHRLIATLKSHGIYTNLNLKVSRELTEADGMPEAINDVKGPLFIHQKRLDYFNRRWIDLQKAYAQQLLATVNPYTGLSLVADPAVAVIEINNENSLLGFWTRDLGRNLHQLPEPFRGELTGLWNQWLAKHHPSDQAIAEAWSKGVTAPGPSIITPASTWTPENQGGTKLTIVASNSLGADAQPIEFRVESVSGTDWHVQAYVLGLRLIEGATYTVEFSAKANDSRGINVGVNKDSANWDNQGLQQWISLGTDWQPFSMTFIARKADASTSRFGFILGQKPGSVWIRNLTVCPGVAGGGLQAGQSAAAGTVPIPERSTTSQWRDWLDFLSDTELAYASEMRGFLRDHLQVTAPLMVTQIDYGGLGGLHRERDMEITDTHAYWQHPAFPAGEPWSATRWTIPNSPQLVHFKDRDFGELGKLAMWRVAGRPFSVSEYDHPAPSDYVCEMMPTLSAFAALQDWDAIYPFALASYGAREQGGKIEGFFDHHHHPAKWSFFPAAALFFRGGRIPALTASATIRLASPVLHQAHFADELWNRLIPEGPHGYLTTRLEISSDLLKPGEPARLERQGQPSPGAARVVATAQGTAFVVDAPQAAAIVGHVGGDTVRAGAVSIAAPRFGRDFAALTAVSLDQQPIATSRHVLLTLVGRAENVGMGWNADRTTNHGNWGTAPTIVERIPATITIPADGPRTIHVLAPDGTRKAAKPATIANGVATLTVAAEDQTVHYEITAP